MLRPAVRLSAGSGLASIALLALLFATRGLAPVGLSWGIAYACVGLGMLSMAGFAWIALTLPRGAPWRRKAMMIGGSVAGAILVAALL